MAAGEHRPGEAGRPPAPANRRYITFVGIAFAVLIIVATINTFRNPPGGLLGVNEDVAGLALPEFALPDVRSPLDGDANVYQDNCSSSENPCPADAQRTPACRIDVKGALRICDFFDKPLAISFWFMRGATCVPAQDTFDQVAQQYGDRVGFLSIDVRDDRDAVRKMVAQHGWQVPVGWDRDGAVANLYKVGGCPTVAFVYPGGVFAFARAQEANLTQDKLSADVEDLLSRTKRRASESR